MQQDFIMAGSCVVGRKSRTRDFSTRGSISAPPSNGRVQFGTDYDVARRKHTETSLPLFVGLPFTVLRCFIRTNDLDV